MHIEGTQMPAIAQCEAVIPSALASLVCLPGLRGDHISFYLFITGRAPEST